MWFGLSECLSILVFSDRIKWDLCFIAFTLADSETGPDMVCGAAKWHLCCVVTLIVAHTLYNGLWFIRVCVLLFTPPDRWVILLLLALLPVSSETLPRMNLAGNTFGHVFVCVCVCVCVCPGHALIYEKLDLETLFWVFRYIFRISRLSLCN